MVLWDVLCNGNVGLVGLSDVNVLVDDHTTSTAVGGRCPEIDWQRLSTTDSDDVDRGLLAGGGRAGTSPRRPGVDSITVEPLRYVLIRV